MYNFYMRFWNLTLLTCVLVSSVASSALAADADKRQIAVRAGAPLQASASHSAAAPFAKGIVPLMRFRVKLTSNVDGSVAQVGDPVHGELLDTIMLPNGHYVGLGAHVVGEVTQVDHSKSLLKADFSAKHWRNSNGLLSVKITQVGGKDLLVDTIPAAKTRVERADKKAPPLGVDGQGEITIKYNTAGYTAANAAITGGCFAAGPAGLIIGPVVGAAAGAADPTFAYGRPVTEADGHTHVKGFFKGLVGGLPGGFLISGATNRGLNVSLQPGDIIVFQERAQDR